jgi:pimeloyl-ACP methyl ester carboxylesterase
MGGMVSMALACAHPEAIRALVIVDIGPEVNAEGTKMIRDFVGRNIEFDDMEEFLDRVEKYDPYRKREHIARTVKYNLLRRADGRYVAKADRRRFQSPAGNVRLPGVPALDDLKRLTMPVLVVRGAESNVLQHDAAVRFADLLPRGELVEVPDCGHNVASQNTTDFLRTLHAFLARV